MKRVKESFSRIFKNPTIASFLFSKLVETYHQMNKELKMITSPNDYVSFHENAFQISNELMQSINKCIQIGKHENEVYFNELEKRYEKSLSIKANFSQVNKDTIFFIFIKFKLLISFFKKLLNSLETWKTQPGAYECILDSKTVNGKTFDYYIKLLEHAITDMNRTKC